MSWSLNEVDGLARKAARGSGLSWGLAEDAGKAVRWLASAGLPGPEMLAGLLTRNDGAAYDALCPSEVGSTWSAREGQLCPLISGAAICDRAADIADGRGIDLGATSFPMLILPFVAGAARQADQPIEISWAGTSATLTPDGRVEFSEDSTCRAEQTDAVRIQASTMQVTTPHPRSDRAEIPEDIARTLGKFAHRTYAPDTPESRLAGAGAGLTDND